MKMIYTIMRLSPHAANDGPNDERGVIGHARSADLLSWEILPPISKPGDFGHLEVPQLITNLGHHYLIFSCPLEYQSKKWLRTQHGNFKSGTHFLVSESALGPFSLSTEEFMVGDLQKSLYSGKIIQDPAGDWKFMAFLNNDSDGSFVGKISDPMPVTFTEDQKILVDWRSISP